MQTKRMLRVLIVFPHLGVGGAERVLSILLERLCHYQLDVKLVVLGSSTTSETIVLPPKLDVVNLGRPRFIKSIWPLVCQIWKCRPDIIFSNMSYLNVGLALICPLLPFTTKLVVRETTLVSENNKRYKVPKLWNLLYRLAYRYAAHIICQSQDMKEDLNAHYCVPANNLTVINNPIETNQILFLGSCKTKATQLMANAKQALHVVIIANHRPEKNLEAVLFAIAKLKRDDLAFHFIGDGPLRESLENLTNELCIKKQVFFYGSLKNPYPLISKADVLLLASIYEGYPNVIGEALCLGTPVISTPTVHNLNQLLRASANCVVAKGVSSDDIADAIACWRKPAEKTNYSDLLGDRSPDHFADRVVEIFYRIAQ